MAFDFSTGLVHDFLDRLDTLFPAGSVLELRTGAAPGRNAAATGTVVATITLPATPWAAAAARAKAKSGTWQDASADATGTLGHFRLRASGDANGASTTAYRIEGSITATGGGGDMTVDNTSATSGQTITITSFTVSGPA
jgi:hypothetical protein